jgi:hypothetical protein
MSNRKRGEQAPQLDLAAKGWTAEVRSRSVAKAGWAYGEDP